MINPCMHLVDLVCLCGKPSSCLSLTVTLPLQTSEVEEASAVDAPSFPVSELKADTVSVDSLEETLQVCLCVRTIVRCVRHMLR